MGEDEKELPRYASARQIARRLNIADTSVSRALKSVRSLEHGGLYDTYHPLALAYIEGRRPKSRAQRGIRELHRAQKLGTAKVSASPVTSPEEADYGDVDPEVMARSIRDPQARAAALHEVEKYKHTRARRVAAETANAKERGELIPVALVTLWLQGFAVSLRDSLLSAPERISRGNDAVRDRARKELARGIESALRAAAAEARSRIPALAAGVTAAIQAPEKRVKTSTKRGRT